MTITRRNSEYPPAQPSGTHLPSETPPTFTSADSVPVYEHSHNPSHRPTSKSSHQTLQQQPMYVCKPSAVIAPDPRPQSSVQEDTHSYPAYPETPVSPHASIDATRVDRSLNSEDPPVFESHVLDEQQDDEIMSLPSPSSSDVDDDQPVPPLARFVSAFNNPLTTPRRRRTKTTQPLSPHRISAAPRPSNFFTGPRFFAPFLPWGIVFRAIGKLLLLALICMAAGAIALLWHQNKKEQAPISNLRAFVLSEVVNNDLEGIGDLTVDGLKLYAQATCVGGESADIVRDALRSQLSNIPRTARDEIISSAVIDRMSTTSTRQDTAADVVDQGKAFSYLAFWSTVYNGKHTLMAAKYSTCVMAAGVDIKIGEDLAGFETSSRSVQIGTKPCHCGYLLCETCPEYEAVVAKKPVFKRHKLTLNHQVELHRWMVKQAVDRAGNLVQTRDALSGKWGKLNDNINRKTIGWEKPSGNQFLGEDKAKIAGGSGKSISAESFEMTKDEM